MAWIDKVAEWIERMRRERDSSREGYSTVRTDGSSIGFHPPREPKKHHDGRNMQDQTMQQGNTAMNPEYTMNQTAPPAQYANPGQEPGWYGQQGYTNPQPGPAMYTSQPPVQQQSMQQPPVQQPQAVNPNDNIIYMPHVVQGKNGVTYHAVIRVMMVQSISSAHTVINCLRNQEAIVMNIEGIADERVKDCCLDIIYGASRALEYAFTRIADRSLYLFTPASIDLETNNDVSERSNREIAERWGTAHQPRASVPQAANWPQDYASRSAGGFDRRVANRVQEQGYTDFHGFAPR